MFQSAGTAVTKCHTLSGLNNNHLFLTVLKAGIQTSRCRQICCLGVDSCLPAVYSHGQRKKEKDCSPVYSVLKAASNPLQYSCLENPMDGGAWAATVQGVTKSWTRLSDFTHSLSSVRRAPAS